MNQVSKAVILRVDRIVAGREIPFDKMYFFERSITPLLPHIFPFSLVLTLTEQFAAQLAEYYTKSSERFAKPRHFPMHRRDEGSISEEALCSEFTSVLRAPASYWMVVPVLHLTHKLGTSVPTYLNAVQPRVARKMEKEPLRSYEKNEELRRKVTSLLDSIESYMLIAGKKYQPICLACANHLEMLNGRCFFGSAVCYNQLVQLCPSNFVHAWKAYEECMGRVPTENDEGCTLWDHS